MRPPNKIIALMTDFGYEDPYVAAMKGVALSINPDVVLVDITHNIPSYSIERAAFVLFNVYRYYPPGTVFVVVVDPGVGSKRRALLIVTKNYYFIGPDNGVLIPAAEDDGIEAVFSIENDIYFVKPVSHSFHGRDIFIPVAAWLTRGVEPSAFGPRVELDSVVKLEIKFRSYALKNNCIEVEVIHIDKFGNVILSIPFKELVKEMSLKFGDKVHVKVGDKSFIALVEKVFSLANPGELVLYEDSFGFAELAVNLGSAKELLGVEHRSRINICSS